VVTKLKVCHLTSVHIYSDTRIFIKECHTLAEKYETHLIAPNAPNLQNDNIQIHGVVNNSGSKIQRMTKTVRKVYKKALEINADVYHFHDPELIFVGLLLKNKGKKVIYDVHEDVPKQVLSKHWIPKYLRKLIGATIEVIERYASMRFTAIVTATPDISARFKKYNPNVYTVQNFPLLDEWLFYDENKEQDCNSSDDIVKLVYVGNITKPRGIIEIVNSLALVNQEIPAKLLLGGQFASSKLEEEVKRLPGWKYVEFLGWLNREQVKETMGKGDIGLVLIHPEPRYKVSYPVKLFEYMSSGLPTIASDFPLWKDLVEYNHCGKCVNPLDPNEIATAIIEIQQNPDEAERMKENGKSAVQTKYNWRPEAKKLLALYVDIANGKLGGYYESTNA
jgi:glycosyltransferase involved in cell wall biosynthesis